MAWKQLNCSSDTLKKKLTHFPLVISVCRYMSMLHSYVCVYYVCGGQRLTLGIFLNYSLSYFLRKALLPKLELSNLGDWLVSKPRDPLPASPVLGLQACTIPPLFFKSQALRVVQEAQPFR